MVRADMEQSMNHFIHVHQTLEQCASQSVSACDRALLYDKLLTLEPLMRDLWTVCEKHLSIVPPMPCLQFADLAESNLIVDHDDSDADSELDLRDFVPDISDSEVDADSDC